MYRLTWRFGRRGPAHHTEQLIPRERFLQQDDAWIEGTRLNGNIVGVAGHARTFVLSA
jgi:hypothetical protein